MEQIRKILRVAPRPLVSVRHNLGLIWSAKAGSIFAVKWFFYQTDLLEEALNYNPFVHRFRRHCYYKSIQHPEIKSSLDLDQIQWIKFVRHPVQRTVSSYIHAVINEFGHQIMASHLDRPVNKRDGFSFIEFLDYLATTDLGQGNLHFRIQSHPIEHLIEPEHLHVVPLKDFRHRLESLENQLSLKQSPLSDFWMHRNQRQRGEVDRFVGEIRFHAGVRRWPKYPAFINDDIKERIFNLYQSDFEQYEFEL